MLVETQKELLKEKIIFLINECSQDSAKLNELIFNVGFLIMYEDYFNEDAFIHMLVCEIKAQFDYHFMSDRESNRLDKPEWAFEFLERCYLKAEENLKIYRDCLVRRHPDVKVVVKGKSDAGARILYQELINGTKQHIAEKLDEIIQSESRQKEKLIFHFGSEFVKFNRKINGLYAVSMCLEKLGATLHKFQIGAMKREIEQVQDLPYVQWFSGYRAVYKNALAYAAEFGQIDKGFQLDGLTRLVVLHITTFIENLRLINLEEIRAVCFIHMELGALRAYIGEVESDIMFESHSSVLEGISTKSIRRISKTCSEIQALLEKLAEGVARPVIQRLVYFNHTSNETKRGVLVEIQRIIENFHSCVHYSRIEAIIAKVLDEFFTNDLLLSKCYKPDEYLELREYYLNMKKLFEKYSWDSDRTFEAADAFFDGEHMENELFQKISGIYN